MIGLGSSDASSQDDSAEDESAEAMDEDLEDSPPSNKRGPKALAGKVGLWCCVGAAFCGLGRQTVKHAASSWQGMCMNKHLQVSCAE